MNTEQLTKIRHSLAHLLAQAVKEVMPEAKLAIGPVIDNGFYYDFDLPRALTPDDLVQFENRMKELIREEQSFSCENRSLAEAKEWAEKTGERFKMELIEDLQSEGEESFSFYDTGDGRFIDLCKGPHVDNTSEIPIDAFKLTRISGAYWRGDENKEQLQRVYGVAFNTKEELDSYLSRQEEAQRRDHRRIGKEMDLFVFSPLVGSGLPLFGPAGNALRERLVKFIMSLQLPAGFETVNIPHITKSDLYKVSGHWEKFGDDLFRVIGKSTDEMAIKPMNCPHHTQIFASQSRSYRDLPIRYAEVTTCYRDEQAGELHGLSRVRSLTQDDGHVFCREDQVEAEVKNILGIIKTFYEWIGMPLSVMLSKSDPKQPDKYLGDRALWERAESTLQTVLEANGYTEYEVGVGEAAFYGPKVDFRAEDALGRSWQLATVQLDFNLPERFKLEYVDEKGDVARPVMIHRAVLGSMERFLSVIIEHYAGRFPFWLAPEQIRILPVAQRHEEYAAALAKRLRFPYQEPESYATFMSKISVLSQKLPFPITELAATIDPATETLGKRIREAELKKIPVVVVVGDQELSGSDLKPRYRQDIPEDLQAAINVFLSDCQMPTSGSGI